MTTSDAVGRSRPPYPATPAYRWSGSPGATALAVFRSPAAGAADDGVGVGGGQGSSPGVDPRVGQGFHHGVGRGTGQGRLVGPGSGPPAGSSRGS